VGQRGANIDHLVIGPGGVFRINTKNLIGSVWVGPRTLLHNGQRTAFLPKAVAEARRASELLTAAAGRPVEVRAVLAIIADEWTVKAEPTDVIVLGPRSAKNVILRHAASLSRADVIAIAAAAAKPITWTAPPPRVKAAPAPVADPPSKDRCSCGGDWVLRTRKRDGYDFFGCSRFPSCRRTKPIVI
jgi:Nuclease-related domain